MCAEQLAVHELLLVDVPLDDHGEGVAAAFLPYGEGVDAHFLPDCGTGDGLRLVSNRRISLSNEGASTCRSAASRREHVDDHLQKDAALHMLEP